MIEIDGEYFPNPYLDMFPIPGTLEWSVFQLRKSIINLGNAIGETVKRLRGKGLYD